MNRSNLMISGECGGSESVEFILGGQDAKPKEFGFAVLLGYPQSGTNIAKLFYIADVAKIATLFQYVIETLNFKRISLELKIQSKAIIQFLAALSAIAKQVFVLVPDGKIFYTCGASLVNRYYVISAAHCFQAGQKIS